jgi:hypothetical protein
MESVGMGAAKPTTAFSYTVLRHIVSVTGITKEINNKYSFIFIPTKCT